MSPSDLTRRMEAILVESGIRELLRFLNERTSHRFTRVYRFDAPMLRNVHLFDRTNPALEVGEDQPLRETYCSIAGATEVPFATADAAADPRLEGHPAREATLSYCGVPIRNPEGEPMGTLCHFDLVPRDVPDADIPVLERAAELIEERIRAA